MPDGAPPIDPDSVARRIAVLLGEGRPGAVKPLLAALARLAPAHEQLALLQAGYWCQLQDFAQALAVLDAAIAGQPENAGLWLCQAEIYFFESRFEEAVRSAAQAVVLAPESYAAKSRLGLALMRLQKFDQALPCLAESFAACPADIEVALALAALLPGNAVETLCKAIVANPKSPVLRNALLRRYLQGGDIEAATQMARQAIGDGAADAQTHCLLAFAQMEAALWDAAAASVARARSIAPKYLWAARLDAALSSRASGRIMPEFPQDADLAEQALIAGGAIAPGVFRSLIAELETTARVLDLFCGTGLNAIAAQGLDSRAWTGIDPRAALIARCAERGLYAGLLQGDPPQMLNECGEYEVILLNENLGHLESPQAFLASLRPHLAPGGVMLAAIPTGSGLGGHGLFRHREAAIAQYAAGAGLSFEAPRSGVLRHLEGLPIHGVIACFRAL